VRDALNGRQGRFYGVGVTSGRPGYYLSYALSQQGRQRGVATVKVNLEEVETTWRGLPGDVLLVDEHSVVILASRAPWKYRPLEPLDAEALQEAMQERRYGQAALQPLGWRVRESLQADARLLEVDGARQLASTRQLPENEWRLMALDDVTEVADSARNAAAMAALGCGVLLLLGIVGWMRGRAGRLERAIQVQLQAANDKLETKVLERTAELRAAQDELVHAGKMAALGQMSAGMVHELNQPLTAMRTLTDNAAVMLKRVSTEPMRLREVEANLARIARLVDRLGRLTGQLKSFAYKTETRRVPVDVAQVLDGARLLLGQRLQDEAVTLTVQVRPARLRVLGDASLLEQVMVNLMGNAIDAMAQAPRKELRVAAWVQQTRCLITVTDSGTGIRADMLTRLFEPFATTKVAGAGLGLGLMISAHLVRDLGGSLQGSNAEGGGACFTVELPCGDLDDSHGPE
jgi:two-component system C4-dicarboxylate transport sensor histidine kinase DctB